MWPGEIVKVEAAETGVGLGLLSSMAVRPWTHCSTSLSLLENMVGRGGVRTPSLNCLLCQELGDGVREVSTEGGRRERERRLGFQDPHCLKG